MPDPLVIEDPAHEDIESAVRELLRTAGLPEVPATIRGMPLSLTLTSTEPGGPPWAHIETVVRGVEIVPDGIQLLIDPDSCNLPIIGLVFARAGRTGSWVIDFYCTDCERDDPSSIMNHGWVLAGFSLGGVKIPLHTGKASA